MDVHAGRWVIGAVLLLLAPIVRAEQFLVPICDKPPIIDGRIDAEEWTNAAGFDGFAWQGQLDRRRVRAMVTATGTHIYIAVRSQLPAEGELLAAVDKDVERLVFDDSVELWIDPTPASESGAAYQLIANSLGRRYFAMHPRGNVKAEPGWNGNWTVACGKNDGWWDCEIAIPLSSVGMNRKTSDGEWGINICRNWKNPWAFSSLGGTAYPPGHDVSFRFASGAPAIRHEHRSDPISGRVESVIAVNGVKNDIRVVQRLSRDTMPDVVVDEKLTGSKQVPLRVDNQGTAKSARLSIEVTSADGKTILYSRKSGWKIGPSEWTWKARTIVKPPIDVQFAYYPYLKKMRVLVDVSGIGARAKLEHVLVSVRDAQQKTLASVKLDKFDANGRQAKEFELGGLDGTYELVAMAAGTNVPAGEVVKRFERKKFEWEHNKLGTGGKTYPPFEPLKLESDQNRPVLKAVLREHYLNDEGVWEQVIAKSAHTGIAKPILAEPMRYRMVVDGEERKLERRAPMASGVTEQVSFVKAGPVFINFDSDWHEDGMVLTGPTLSASEPHRVDSLTLEIPFRNDQATLMHAMSEGIRNPIVSQRIPPGEGVVWDSNKLAPSEFPKGFCTYIYVGNAVRGICWFAENDRGWSRDPGRPNVELVRKSNMLTMRVHLINRPISIKEPRTITFGLQAAPVKPRLSPWRYRWYRENFHLLGTDINWLALGDCGSVYPAGKDLKLWEMIAKGSKQSLSEEEIRSTAERAKKYFEPYGRDKVSTAIAHARHNLTAHLGANMVFYYNRASYQAAEEFQTFQDEWGLSDYRTIGEGRSIGEIKIVPSESYIDHALWWYAKSFEVGGNRGVYWDNWFIVPSFNTTMTAAYQRDDGSIAPATGVLAMRELCRRTFNLMNERHMRPITMPHMTSTNILPMLGFATVQYDWEWKYSEGDVQYRYPREYLLLVSNGELAGTWPVLLGDHGKQENDPWVQRTFAGVSIVHELNPSPSWATQKAVWKPLIDPIIALLDDPNLQVWRYWDERPMPVQTNDADLPGIVYCVPGKQAIFAVTSYGEKDVEAMVNIDAKALGLSESLIVTDVESGKKMDLDGNQFKLTIKKHDVREFRIERSQP